MTVTPMMSQWQVCKEQAKDALLFFRLGDFYEAFYDDAKIISKEIGLTLTARQNIPMCGVPFHTAESYIDKLIAKGFKIAIAEQTEQTKGLIKREIARIVTPGTIVNSQLINDKNNNFFVSIVDQNRMYGLAAIDLTTAEFKVRQFDKESSLIDELCRLKPKELLVSEHFPFLKELSFHFGFIVNQRPMLDPKLSFDVLTGHFDVTSLEPFGLRGKTAAITAAGSLLLYLKEELNIPLDHIQSIETESNSQFMEIDRSSMRNLEINESFFKLLDETRTPMGARLLRMWVQYPLLSPEKIAFRQHKIESFIQEPTKAQAIQEKLSHIRDLERLMMKICAKYAGPRDLYALGVSLSVIPELKRLLPEENLFDAEPIAKRILSTLNETLPLRLGEADIFKDGVDEELDRLRNLSRDSMSWMASYQVRLREETGIKTLKVGFTRAFGYYIEVSRAQSDRIPEFFHRRQTLVNAERFVTEELKSFEHQVLTSEERSKAIEAELFEKLRAEIASHSSEVNLLAKAIAQIDALLSLATIAAKNSWIAPVVDESCELEIIQGRHPIIEEAIGKASFIPNDTHLNSTLQLMLITGPNMAGKSTYIRQVAIIAILAQIGSYIPAKQARIGVIDKIFSRIGASDDLARGQSTFMVEMSETANILHNATSKSLVLLDEIGRGTSTYDGISIAWAVAEHLLTTPKKQAKTLFATHYWELTKLETEFPHAANFQTAVQEVPSGIVFLRKIIKGGTDKSYGIHVAKLAGLPIKAIQRAKKMLKKLEDAQLPLFTPPPNDHPVLAELKKIDLDSLTPLIAYQLLTKIKTEI